MKRTAALARPILQFAFRTARYCLPKKPTVRQIAVEGGPLLVWINEYIGARLFVIRQFERNEAAFFKHIVHPGDVVLDIGANIGLHSMIFAKGVGPSGTVICCEPVRRNALMIRLNAELNDLHNIRVFETAVFDRDDSSMEAISADGDSAFGYFKPTPENTTNGGISTTTVDTLISRHQLPRIDVVKMDIEGGEMRALSGARRLVRDVQPRCFVVEVCDDHLARFGDNHGDIMRFFADAGYRAFRIEKNGLAPFAALSGSENICFLRSSDANEIKAIRF